MLIASLFGDDIYTSDYESVLNKNGVYVYETTSANSNDKSVSVEMKVPGIGSFNIELEYLGAHYWLYIRSIEMLLI